MTSSDVIKRLLADNDYLRECNTWARENTKDIKDRYEAKRIGLRRFIRKEISG
jgi:hypothetical protein